MFHERTDARAAEFPSQVPIMVDVCCDVMPSDVVLHHDDTMIS